MQTKETNNKKIKEMDFLTVNDMEVKAQKSSARMEVCQHEAATIKDNEECIQSFEVNTTTHLDTFIAKNARSNVSTNRERKRKSNEDIKRREIDKIQAVAKASELSRKRSMFNGNKNTLPSIGKGHSKVDSLPDKLLPAKENVPLSHICQDAISVISKHEARIRTTSVIKNMSMEFVSADVKLIEPLHKNTAPEIIEAYEREVGRPYERYGGYPTGSAILHGSYARPHCSKSSLMPRTSPARSNQSPH